MGLGWFLVSLSMEEEAPSSQHGEAPSLDCFSCHGPHPAKSAEEINLASFAIPPHTRGPELSCSYCHDYSPDVEKINPNSCVGCHDRGGYPVKAALEDLIKAGHPPVIPAMETIPKDCHWCHRDDLGARLHQRHLFESQKFVLHFQSGCTRCHPLGKDGKPQIENQPLE